MSSHSDKAVTLFLQGYNCSQAVFAAFCDDMDLDFETALKLSSSFGGVIGRLRELCVAVSGMFLVAGMKYGYSDPVDHTAKAEHYKRIQELAETFKVENGSLICRELLGLGREKETYVPDKRTIEFYKKRPCVELVRQAAKMMDEYIENNKMEVMQYENSSSK